MASRTLSIYHTIETAIETLVIYYTSYYTSLVVVIKGNKSPVYRYQGMVFGTDITLYIHGQ